jgi:hypothetical protein
MGNYPEDERRFNRITAAIFIIGALVLIAINVLAVTGHFVADRVALTDTVVVVGGWLSYHWAGGT